MTIRHCFFCRLKTLLRPLMSVTCLCLLLINFPQPLRAQINTDRVMTIGRNALYFEDYVLAIQYFNQVIRAKSYMAEPYLYRAIAKLSLEDYLGAESDCSEALERNPFMIKAYYCRSYARMNLNKYEASIEDCQRGLEFDTENRSLMLNKAISRLYAKQYDEARRDLNDLIGRFPRYMYAYMSRGQLCIEVNDTLGAIDDFSRAISVDKYYAPAYAARGYVSLLREKYSDAVPDFSEAIRLEPDNEGYYINRGLARYYLKDYRGTLSDFDRVLQLNPNSSMTYFNRGLIRAEVGDDNRAIEDFDKVIYLQPDNDLAIYNRAILREGVGDNQGAEQDLSVIIERYPNFIPAYQQRSQVRKKMGNDKGADSDYFAAWKLEDKLKEERAAGRSFQARGDSTQRSKTRKESENNIEQYNRVIVSETDMEQTTRYANPIRGRVQDLKVEIDIEPMFGMTFYEQARPVGGRKAMNYASYVEALGASGLNMKSLLITNMEKSLNGEQVNVHFRSIDHYSKMISENAEKPELFFARAIDFAMVKDLTGAISDLDRALYLDKTFVLAYFERANLRFNKLMVEFSASQEQLSSTASSTANLASESNASTGALSITEGNLGSEYMSVMQDYDNLLEIAPDFVYAWYNRGNIRCMQKDYRSALEDYNKAILLSPEFAEAWYNRGLTRIFLGEREDGLNDLSRAGELGIYKAYHLMKRFSVEN